MPKFERGNVCRGTILVYAQHVIVVSCKRTRAIRHACCINSCGMLKFTHASMQYKFACRYGLNSTWTCSGCASCKNHLVGERQASILQGTTQELSQNSSRDTYDPAVLECEGRQDRSPYHRELFIEVEQGRTSRCRRHWSRLWCWLLPSLCTMRR